jgi:hypothetical protein
MSIRVLGTFQSRDAADSVRDHFIQDGFNAADLIVMANRESAEPPEDADLEVGTEGQGGMKEFEEKIGKAFMQLTHRENPLAGDGTEGVANRGALLGVTVRDQASAEKVKQMLLEHYFAADVEVAEAD